MIHYSYSRLESTLETMYVSLQEYESRAVGGYRWDGMLMHVLQEERPLFRREYGAESYLGCRQ